MSSELHDEIRRLRAELKSARDREDLLRQIDGAMRSMADAAEVTRMAATLLGQRMRVNRCAYMEVEPDGDSMSVVGDYTDGLPSMAGTYSLRDFSAAAPPLLSAGEPFVVDDMETDPRCADTRENFLASGIRAGIGFPLMKAGRLTAILSVHGKAPRRWLPAEVALVGAVADRTWESVERSRAVRALEIDREELRRRSMESERQHAELKTIYDTAPIGLAYFDLDDYHYLRLNKRQAAFFGLEPEQVVGRTLIEMAPIPGLRELFDQVAGGEPVVNYPLEGTLATDPNEYRYWTVSYFPVYGPDGAIQGITAASQEITQQKKAEKALIQAEKLAAVGRLASSIAHEINNPLEAVTNLLYLARSAEEVDEVHAHLDLAESELRRISAITAQTLRFHRQSTSPQEIDANLLAEEIVNLYQGRFRNASVDVSMRKRAQRALRCFDGEVRQVLANLIANAVDAMNTSQRCLFVRTREATHWASGERGVTFTIADSGSGIPPDAIARLFEPFFTTKGMTGTGLGLWVSQEIVQRHRGAIRLRSSRSPRHHGTVFTVFFPFEAAER